MPTSPHSSRAPTVMLSSVTVLGDHFLIPWLLLLAGPTNTIPLRFTLNQYIALPYRGHAPQDSVAWL